ncbi:hypothetical protein PVAG01_08234 [Phlyctema vagabunda]|uniref:Uncharacterized protein n=1 Tax=Phlyctema vagabunda TaxID=108571 RepID=A0ABR4P9I6_9HELO
MGFDISRIKNLEFHFMGMHFECDGHHQLDQANISGVESKCGKGIGPKRQDYAIASILSPAASAIWKAEG